MEKKPLYLLDGYSLIYRTYFAFIRRPLINSKGMNVSILYGFFNTLFSFYKKYEPEFFSVVLDPKGPTFRHEEYPEYKANREKAPDDLHAQIPVVQEILEKLGVPILRRDRFEADDVIATLAKKCSAEKRQCFILSGDKDLLQLVDDYVSMLKPSAGNYEQIGYDEVVADKGIRPDQIIDYLALTGDTADNVPGVKGIGPKTAASLLQKYETLDGVYENISVLAKGAAAKLESAREEAYLSRGLVTLADVADLPAADELKASTLDREAAGAVFAEYEVKAFAGGASAGDKSSEKAGKSGSKGASQELFSDEETFSGEYEVFQKGSVEIIDSEAELDKMLAQMDKKKVFAFDSETDSVDSMVARPVGFSFSCDKAKGYYIPLVAGGEKVMDEELVRGKLAEFFSRADLKVVGQNLKYDYKVMKRWGVELPLYFDTMIAAWLIDAQAGQYGMDKLAERYLHYSTIKFSDVVEKKQKFEDAPLEPAADYAGEDAIVTYRLFREFEKKLTEAGLQNVFFTMEMEVLKILAEAECRGIYADKGMLGFFEKKLSAELEGYEKEIYSECGKEFNINSTKQLQEILFTDLGLKPVKKTKTGFSTDISVLTQLSSEHVVPELVLKHRLLSKLISTYIRALPELINEETGRIHTQFVQTGTATGRLSSRDPNLQNIPIKTEQGRLVRKAFRPAEGKVFVSADYSQVELVLLAHLSGDEALKSAFIGGEDIHKETAAFLFSTEPELVTAEQRRIAKTINFGVIYGMSSFRLGRELKIPVSTAATFIESYFQRFASVKSYIAEVVEGAEKDGFVETLLGHRRPIQGINSRNKTEKAGAERVALNSVIQGSGADVIKTAMIKIDRVIKERSLKAELLLQIHDELLFEVEESAAAEFEGILREVMEEAVLIDVPLRVSVESGGNWGDLH
jgi:DNA polymerase-1